MTVSAKTSEILSFALTHDGKRRLGRADNLMATLTAHYLLEHLERSGYVIMQKPPAAMHSAPAASSAARMPDRRRTRNLGTLLPCGADTPANCPRRKSPACSAR